MKSKRTQATPLRWLLAGGIATFGTILAFNAGIQAQDDLSGTININIKGENQDVWEKMAKEYMKIHPKVKVNVALKPQQGYADYINAGFAAGEPSFDIVLVNENAALLNEGKFLDFAPYLNQPNPYIGGKPWREAIDLKAMQAINANAKVYALNLENVQILWFYNKTLFTKAGVKGIPKTWNELLAACEKIKKAGIIPFALSGNYDSLWASNGGWMFRMYADQYTRSLIEDQRSKPGDYTFDNTIDPNFKFDPTDPYNDDSDKVTLNPLRRFAAIRASFTDPNAKMNRWRVDSLPLKALHKNLYDLLSKYTPPGWFGIDQNAAYSLFLQQKAAILLDGGWRLTGFEKDLAGFVKVGDKVVAQKKFPLGVFNNPSMTGEYVQAPARTISVAIGFYGAPKKSFAQNKLNVDFLQWYTSPKGYGKYIDFSVKSPKGNIIGPPIIKNVEFPASLKARYANIVQIGNTEKSGTGGAGARGLDDYQESVRTWVNLMQQYLSDKISTDEFASANQKNIQDNFEEVLKFQKLTPDDLKTPEKKPPTR